MKYFLVSITCYDGVHEHNYRYIAKGKDQDTVADRLAREQTYEYGDEAPNAMTSFGDGETGADANIEREIPKEHFQFLKDNRYMYEV